MRQPSEAKTAIGRRSDRGATLPVVAVMIVPLTIMVALVVDIGAKKQLEAQAQGAVDAAALASTYSVASINPGDLDAAALIAQKKVEQNFKIKPGSWDSCIDPDHYALLPPGVAGECISFDDSGANPVARVKLPPVEFRSFFGRIVGMDSISVESSSGADGQNGPGSSVPGSTVPPSSSAGGSSTSTPTTTVEEGCLQQFATNHWDDVWADYEATIRSQVDAQLTADNYDSGQWWDGSPESAPAPSTGLTTPPNIPAGCSGVPGVDPPTWRDWDEWHWDDMWRIACEDWFIADRGFLPDGVCGFGSEHPPTGSGGPTSSTTPPSSTPGGGGPGTSGDITLG
ncbi:MAG: Tad domain-containing protein [Microthrixaceae bacterium]